MRRVLSDKPLLTDLFPEDTEAVALRDGRLGGYAGDPTVVAIVGSRAMAREAEALSLPGLRLFQLTSAGFDGVPVASFSQKDVWVCHAGDTYTVPIAETVVYGMLQMARRYRRNPNHHWLRLTRHYRYLQELYGKSVMILGAGRIGTAVAERLAAFGMTVYGYDPYCPEKPPYRSLYRTFDALLEALPGCDYVVSTLPDTPQTRGCIGPAFVDRLKPGSVFVNVGRQATIDRQALYGTLKSRRIGGAVLDMFEPFPNPLQNPFRRLSNVIVLPGVAAISREADERLTRHVSQNVAAVLRGETPAFIVRPPEDRSDAVNEG